MNEKERKAGEEDIRAKIREYALQNAIKYEKEPKTEAVMKKLLSEHPELKKHVRVISTLMSEEIKSIATMGKEDRIRELKEIAPKLLEEIEIKRGIERAEFYLPELPYAEIGKVVMRFAPNPNGPPTLGSARGMVINSDYAKKYEGKFILRFDDTDPALKKPLIEAYDWYLEDCIWLGAKPDEVVTASERVDLYYKYAKEVIEKRGAYVCFCNREAFKEYKEKKIPCPHRDVSVEENLGYWDKMLRDAYEEREAVLRIKTDMTLEDSALIDWVAFRILKTTHPKVGNGYNVWPTLNFESAIEDHLLGTTHIIRGKDLMKSEKKQKFLYAHFGWEYPVTIHWGKIKIHKFGKFSTSELRRKIERGEYEGWYDPRLPTIRALKRRGFQPEAIRKFFIKIGISQNDIAMSMKNLYAENREIVDEKASRYFFVRNPKKMEIKGLVVKVVRALKHPSRLEYREIKAGNFVYISGDDFLWMKAGQKIRLKFLCNVEIESVEPLSALAKVIEEDIKKPIIHWTPSDGIKVEVKKPEGSDKGLGEPLIASEVGNVVQFERYGFVRINSFENGEVVAYFTH